jgi:arsenate reductase (thioredoxin)
MLSTILFLCPHGAAKSVLAAAYFNRLAQESGLSLVADAAGTEPSEAVSPAVVQLLRDQGFDEPRQQPQHVSRDALSRAQHVISMGCELKDLDIAPERVEQWLDIPSPSANLHESSEAIRAHVEKFVAQIREP